MDGTPPIPAGLKSIRWEVPVAALCFVAFFALADLTQQISRALAPGESYGRLAEAAPFFVLTPALAISALRNRRANQVSKWLAGGILAIFVLTSPTWYMVSMIFRAVSLKHS